jgi:Bacterial protein of unknown function (DUF899)
MDWRFLWVSSVHNDFNHDFHVSFTPEDVAAGNAEYNYGRTQAWMAQIQDLSGRSVFFKNGADEIFHTYSAYGRGGEDVLGIYAILDSMPKGRNETGPYHSLGDWVRPWIMYGKGGTVEGNGRYHAPACGCCDLARGRANDNRCEQDRARVSAPDPAHHGSFRAEVRDGPMVTAEQQNRRPLV